MDLPVHYEDRLVARISADAQATRLAYADAWSSSAIIRQRERIQRQAMDYRRLQHRKLAG